MKCVCVCKHQRREEEGKRPGWIFPGDTRDFDECPTHFVPLENFDIDFMAASERELLSEGTDLTDMKKFILDKFGEKAGNRGKEKTVEMLLDLRYRFVEDRKAESLI